MDLTFTSNNRRPATNIALAIGGLNGFVSTEVQNSTFVLRLKFSAKNPAHRQYAGRHTSSTALRDCPRTWVSRKRETCVKPRTVSKQLRKEIYILIFSLITTLALGQTEKESFWKPYSEFDRIKVELKHYDSITFEKAYRVWTDYQVVELI